MMSRIGKLPIPVPNGVEVAIDGQHVTVKGPKGSCRTSSPSRSRSLGEDGTLHVVRPDDERESSRCTACPGR